MANQLEWKAPDVDGLVDFLVKDKGFKYAALLYATTYLSPVLILPSEERVRKGAEKLTKFLNAKQQGRLDGFFTVKTKSSPDKSKETKGKSQGKVKEERNAKGRKRKVFLFTPCNIRLVLNVMSRLGLR